MKPSNQRPLVIGLVGGIGSGKSTVADAFADLGARVIDADVIAHACLSLPTVRRALRERYGDAVFADDGAVDRAKLARVVFRSATRLRQLESLLHPPVLDRITRTLDSRRNASSVVVIDAPLLLECHLESLCDVIVYVKTPARIRRARLRKSRGWSIDDIRRRESFQLPLQKKAGKADYSIDNSCTPSEAISQVRQLWKKITGARPPAVRHPHMLRGIHA